MLKSQRSPSLSTVRKSSAHPALSSAVAVTRGGEYTSLASGLSFAAGPRCMGSCREHPQRRHESDRRLAFPSAGPLHCARPGSGSRRWPLHCARPGSGSRRWPLHCAWPSSGSRRWPLHCLRPSPSSSSICSLAFLLCSSKSSPSRGLGAHARSRRLLNPCLLVPLAFAFTFLSWPDRRRHRCIR